MNHIFTVFTFELADQKRGLVWRRGFFLFAAFFVLFTALLAEGNRTPFDLPEAESEIVAGYNTEYSGMRFGYFFLAEWGNLWVMSAILTTLFMGGWQVPMLDSRLRMWEAAGTVPEVATASVGTLRQRLWKVGAVVVTSARRVWLHVAANWPCRALWLRVQEAVARYVSGVPGRVPASGVPGN